MESELSARPSAQVKAMEEDDLTLGEVISKLTGLTSKVMDNSPGKTATLSPPASLLTQAAGQSAPDASIVP